MTLIKTTLRRGTASQWATANPTLLNAEIALITDEFEESSDGTKRYRIKIGPGAFNSLNYASFESALGIADIAGLQAALDDKVDQSYVDTAIDTAEAAAISAAATDATTKANAAQSAAISAAATDATNKANAAQAAAIAASQPSDSDLTAIAGLSPANDDIIQRKSGAWTNRTLSQLAADLATVSGVALRTGSTIAFDAPAIYNTPTSPSNGTVTLDLSGAVAGTEVVACFNHATEPSWPSGVTAVGVWNNSAVNVVRFVFLNSTNIVAVINSDAGVASSSNGFTIIRKTTATTRTSSTVLAVDPDMKMSLPANSKVNIRLTLYAVTTAAADFKYRINGPASPALIRGRAQVIQSSGTAPAARILNAYDSADQALTAAATFTSFIEVDMYIENGPNAGDFEFQWAQNTSDAGNTTVSRGALLEYLFTP